MTPFTISVMMKIDDAALAPRMTIQTVASRVVANRLTFSCLMMHSQSLDQTC